MLWVWGMFRKKSPAAKAGDNGGFLEIAAQVDQHFAVGLHGLHETLGELLHNMFPPITWFVFFKSEIAAQMGQHHAVGLHGLDDIFNHEITSLIVSRMEKLI